MSAYPQPPEGGALSDVLMGGWMTASTPHKWIVLISSLSLRSR